MVGHQDSSIQVIVWNRDRSQGRLRRSDASHVSRRQEDIGGILWNVMDI